MKEFSVYAKFHQVPAAHYEQSTTVRATSAPLAMARGLKELMRRPHIAGKVHRVISATVTFMREIPVEFVVEKRVDGAWAPYDTNVRSKRREGEALLDHIRKVNPASSFRLRPREVAR